MCSIAGLSVEEVSATARPVDFSECKSDDEFAYSINNYADDKFSDSAANSSSSCGFAPGDEDLLLKRPQKAEIESVEKVSKTSEGEKFPMAFTSTLHCVNFTPDERIASVVLFCCRRSIIHEEHHDYIQT